MVRVSRLLVGLTLFAGCGGGGLPTDKIDASVGLVSIAVSPSTATLAPGTKATFTAIGTNSDGTTEDVTSKATWSSSDPTVANGGAGMLSANKPGTTTLTAKLDGVSGSAQITVTSANVTAVTTAPPSAMLTVGGTVSLTATATFGDGTMADVTHGATWSSNDPSIAKVSNAGLATGNAAGSTGIVATYGGKSGTTMVSVTGKNLKSLKILPNNATLNTNVALHFNATGTYDDNTTGDVTAIANWVSSMPGVVSVAAGGFANTNAAGMATITASVGGVSGTATITVTAVPLSSIEIIAPDGAILPHNAIDQLQAIGHYIDGTKADLTQQVTWSSDNPMLIAITNAGVVTSADTPGDVTITASFNNFTITYAMIVTKAKLGTILINLGDQVIPKGAVLHYTATGVYNDGSYIPITHDVMWTIADPTVASFDNTFPGNGTLTALMPGMTMFTASFENQMLSEKVAVTAANLDSVEVKPAATTIKQASMQPMTATAHYSDQTSSDVTMLATWSSNDVMVATISNQPGTIGVVTAISPGTTTISANFNKVLGTTNLSVVP
jgi:hypothetical protein